MGYWGYFVWRLGMIFDHLTMVPWPIDLALLAGAVAAAAWSRQRLRVLLGVRGVLQILPLVVLPAMAYLGMVYPALWIARMPYALLVAQAIGAALLIWGASPCRVFAAALQTLLFWMSFVAATVVEEPGPFL